jgi:hypothetical protein
MKVFIDMKLISTDGIELTFQIINYEFPKIKNGIDSNWLKLNIQIKGRGLSINETNPCLLTNELDELTRWLMKLMLGKLETNQYWESLEGNFTFEFGGVKENVFLLKIYLRDNLSVELSRYSLDFLYTDKELSKLIQSLIKFQKKFPVRDKSNIIPPPLPPRK